MAVGKVLQITTKLIIRFWHAVGISDKNIIINAQKFNAMKNIFTLIAACIILSSVQAQTVREARPAAVQFNSPKGHGNYTTNARPVIVQKPQYNEHNHHGQHCEETYVSAMSWEAFTSAKQQIASQSFDSNRLDIAKQITSWNYMTASQIREIACLFTFDSNRLDYAKFAFQNCINQGEYFMLYDVFTFSSNARELSEFIGMR